MSMHYNFASESYSVKAIFLPTLFLLISATACAQVGIGTTTPDTAAALDVASSSKALIVPRLTNTAMNAIQVPVEGMIVYNTDSSKFFGYGGPLTGAAISQAVNTSGIASTSIKGQSFTPAVGFSLSSINVPITAAGNALTVEMTVRSGAGNVGPVQAISTVTLPAGAPSTVTVNFLFPAAVALQAGAVYTFSLLPVGSSAGAIFGVRTNINDPYADGSYYSGSNTTASSTDLVFTIYRALAKHWHALD